MFNLTEQQFNTMIGLQESMNSRVTTAWREENYPWVDAIWTEAAEAFNHMNWPWWKGEGEVPNVDAIKLELIDIWHFMLSEIMMNDSEFTAKEEDRFIFVKTICIFSESVLNTFAEEDLALQKKSLKFIVQAALETEPGFNRLSMLISGFAIALMAFNMTWDEVFKLYVGKNTLNKFRQDHDYKKNTAAYKAVWHPKEDNDFLTDILSSLDVKSDTFKEDIYSKLKQEWESNIDKTSN